MGNNFLNNTKNVSKFHLTLTGFQAGRPLCDCDKEKELAAGAQFYHAIYAPKMVFDDARLCPFCKEVWEDSGKE